MTSLIIGNNLSKKIGDRYIFKGIDIEINRKEIIALMGPSGVGKSTLLRILCGLDKNYEGKLSNNFVKKYPIGYVPQELSLFPWRNVRQNIELVFELRKVKKSQRVIEVKRLLEKVELLGTELLYPEDLSGGMKQRVALAQVLGNDPEIMFLDEPFSALDLQSRYNMQKLLLRLQNEIGFSVFICR